MGWGSLYSLLLLLGAVPLILFLHSLRPKGVKVRTTALFLWERVLREQPIGKKLGWLLKKNLLLFLQILAALILITALADPSLLHYSSPDGNTVVVVDLSASMKAKGQSGTRFDGVRKAFLSLVDSKAADQKMMVIGAGPTPRVLLPFTSDKKRLKNLGLILRPTDGHAQVKEAVLFAHAFLMRGSPDRVVVFSDGAFDGAKELPWGSAHLRLVGVEGGDHNVGITGFEFRRLPAAPNRYEIMIRIKNFSPRMIRTPFTLTVGEKKWRRESLEIAPNESRVLIYPYRGLLRGKAIALLEIEDDLPTDNRAFLVLFESSEIRVLYAGKGNPFLDRLFRSLPNVQVTSVKQWAPKSSSKEIDRYDIVILDGIPSPALTEGNFILINTVAKDLPLKVKGKMLRPRPLPSVARHPLTEGLRLDDLYIKEALRLELTGEGTVLARSKEGPLIFAYQKGRLRSLVLGFDLLASDLPFRVAFPVLLSNAFDWFVPNRTEFPAAKVQAGKQYALYLPGTDDEVEIESPLGKKEILPVVTNPLPFADTYDAGFYTYKSKNKEGQFAVNLFNESESQISPRLLAKKLSSIEQKDTERTGDGFSLWPYLLAAVIVLLLIEGFLVFRDGGRFYPLVFRLLALSAVVLALVNPKIFRASSALDVILSVDFSRSVGQEGMDKALNILDKARRTIKPETRAGLLFFGQKPSWEFFPRSDLSPAEFSPEVGREETDIHAALQAALAQIGEGRQGRILLISDGNENRGETSRVVPLIRSHRVPVWVLPLNSSQGRNEIYLSDLILPHRVDSAEGFEVRGAIESHYEAPARVKLLLNGVVQSDRAIILKSGTNWVSFKENLQKRGNHTFELLVESTEDTLPENNLLQGVVEVKGPPRVLYLHVEKDDRQRHFSHVLSVQGYSVVESSPEESALSLPEISAFDLLVLDNVPAYLLSQLKMEMIEKYVRDLGGGLVVIGGDESYGAGGYYNTPLERLLPVDIRPPSRLDLPRVLLLYLLDKSGSMDEGPEGATKLDLAKAAAMASADIMNPSDQIGILAFDAEWDWLLPFRRVGDGELLSEHLSSLQSNGGTDLYKAMTEAFRSLSTQEAAIKHLLVLSDGLTDKNDFPSLVKKMVGEGITVSMVAVGQDADLALTTEIARNGKGRAYRAVDPRTIPQIFTTETLLISRDLLVEKLAYPTMVASMGPLKGLYGKRVPPVRGYVLTHPKARSDLLMKIEDDPLLVSWRYGLGNVMAFTSDLSGRWGREWVKWEDFPQWAGQLARSTMRKGSKNQIRTEFRQEGGQVRAVVDFFSQAGGFINNLKLNGNLIAPDQATVERGFQQIAPGRYESRFSIPQRGVHFLTIFEKGENPRAATSVPFIAPYPREYRELKPNTALLRRLAEETGGEVLKPDEMKEGIKRLFTPDPDKATTVQETWWPISTLGLFLFLADLALRRVPGRFRN